MSRRLTTGAMGFGALAAVALLNSAPATAADACDRACLKKTLDGFLSAVFKHDPASVPLSDDYFATENTATVAKGEGAWKSVTGYGQLQRRYFDPVNESAAFFGILKKDGHDQITSVRIRVAGGKVSEAEWIFGTQGPGGRGESNPAGLLKYQPPPEGKLAPAQRASRFLMLTLPNDYFQAVVEHDGSWVPNSKDCIRIENGGGNTFDTKPPPRGECLDHFERFKGLTKDLALRRFPVVDEEAGVVLGTAIYVRYPNNPAQDNLVHEYFLIRDGKISGLWTSMHFLPKGSPVTSGWENR
jgi:hypothetical protein